MGGPDLRRLLGYRTADAFRTAVKARRVVVSTFRIPGRKGLFARAVDVERWLDSLSNMSKRQEGGGP